MRIPFTKIFDDEKTECVVFFNSNERLWLYIKHCDTYCGFLLDYSKTDFSNVGYANLSDFKSWSKSVEYYIISSKHHEILKNILEKVINDIGNRRKYLDRIRNSFVEL